MDSIDSMEAAGSIDAIGSMGATAEVSWIGSMLGLSFGSILAVSASATIDVVGLFAIGDSSGGNNRISAICSTVASQGA